MCGGNGDAGKGRDLLRQHGEAAAAQQRGDRTAAAAREERRRQGAGRPDPGKPSAGAVRHPEIRGPRRKRGRPVPGGLRRAHQGH